MRWGWQTNFAILTALAVLLLLAAWRGLPKHQHVEAQQEQHWLQAMGQAYRRLFREPSFLLYVVILAATTADAEWSNLPLQPFFVPLPFVLAPSVPPTRQLFSQPLQLPTDQLLLLSLSSLRLLHLLPWSSKMS